MVDSIETCREYRATIPLSILKISKLCDFSSRFYESLNGKNRMCELCTFSQIRSHILLFVSINLIDMVDYIVGLLQYLLLLFGVYVGFCLITKWYITVVTWALMVCLIYTPSALGPAALVLCVCISGKPLLPMLQLRI